MIRSLRECGWLALDGFETWYDAIHVAARLRGRFFGVKIHALEYGHVSPWQAIDELQDLGYQVWIDDKQNDIPNSVAHVVRSLALGGADLVSVHAGDDIATIRAAVEAYRAVGVSECARQIPGLGIAVISVLTSTKSSITNLVYAKTPVERAREAARWADIVGAYAIVCSPQEVRALRSGHPGLAYIATGNRSPGMPTHDHERAGTPAEALADGARYLVIGREVLRTPDDTDWNPDMLGAVERIDEGIAYPP